MTRPSTFLRLQDPKKAIIGRKMLLEKSGYIVVQQSRDPEIPTCSHPSALHNPSRPFFSRWLDHWKNRNQVIT